jgi:hypothetical protein
MSPNITISGKNFIDTGHVKVHLRPEHDVEAVSETVEGIVLSRDKLVFDVPDNLFPERYAVTVTFTSEPEQEDDGRYLEFSVYDQAQFGAIIPAVGPACGGTRIRIEIANNSLSGFQDTGDINVQFTSTVGDRLISIVDGEKSPHGDWIECWTPINSAKNHMAEFIELTNVRVALDGKHFVMCGGEFAVGRCILFQSPQSLR